MKEISSFEKHFFSVSEMCHHLLKNPFRASHVILYRMPKNLSCSSYLRVAQVSWSSHLGVGWGLDSTHKPSWRVVQLRLFNELISKFNCGNYCANMCVLFFYYTILIIFLLACDCCYYVLTKYTAHGECTGLLTTLWLGEPRNRGSILCINKGFFSSQCPGQIWGLPSTLFNE
jgi:hypothetical protein